MPGTSNPFRLREAGRAMRRLVADPEDTAQVFRIIEALSGNNGRYNLRRLQRRGDSDQLLDAGGSLLARLTDRAYLTSLPDGSLGRAYLDFLDSEGISAQGLVAASEKGSPTRTAPERADPRLLAFRDRMRDTHDLWHTVTGYKGDLVGEACLLAFSFAQTHNPGVLLIVLVALLEVPLASARVAILSAGARGVRAGWLPAADWEALLPLPLDEVRRQLGTGGPRPYPELRSDGAASRTAT